ISIRIYVDPQDLHSFPTRRSSDLLYGNGFSKENLDPQKKLLHYQGSFPPDEVAQYIKGHFGLVWGGNAVEKCSGILGEYLKYNRSEEHTSELQSRENLVCRLLLEK